MTSIYKTRPDLKKEQKRRVNDLVDYVNKNSIWLQDWMIDELVKMDKCLKFGLLSTMQKKSLKQIEDHVEIEESGARDDMPF